MKNLQKNLLLSAISYVLLVLSVLTIVKNDIPLIINATLFSVIAIFFSVKSFALKESRFVAIMLIIIGILILAWSTYGLRLCMDSGTVCTF